MQFYPDGRHCGYRRRPLPLSPGTLHTLHLTRRRAASFSHPVALDAAVQVTAVLVLLEEVSVSDTGVGIAPEDREAVFEEFRQVGTADKKVEGTGLGLTLCRKFRVARGPDLGEERARGGVDV